MLESLLYNAIFPALGIWLGTYAPLVYAKLSRLIAAIAALEATMVAIRQEYTETKRTAQEALAVANQAHDRLDTHEERLEALEQRHA